MSLARLFWLVSGIAAFAIGSIGIILPLLPTVPFYLLATFCFARSNPRWEHLLLDHPRWGPPLRNWRERRVISRTAKLAALTALATSSVMGLILLHGPWAIAPAIACGITGTWIWTRAE